MKIKNVLIVVFITITSAITIQCIKPFQIAYATPFSFLSCPSSSVTCVNTTFWNTKKVVSAFPTNYQMYLFTESYSAGSNKYYSYIYCPLSKVVTESWGQYIDSSVKAMSASGCVTIKQTCTTLGTCSSKTGEYGGVVHLDAASLDTSSSSSPGDGSTTPTGGASTGSGADPGLDVPPATFEGDSWASEVTSTADCSASDDPTACLSDPGTSSGKVVAILSKGLTILSGLIVVSAVIMLIVGGVQYSSAGGNPDSVGAAKKKISNVLIGLLAYVFLYAFLQWLIPGGIVIW